MNTRKLIFLKDRDKEKSVVLDEEIGKKERENVKLRNLVEEMDGKIKFLTETLNSRNGKLERMETELETRLSENSRLRNKLDEVLIQMDYKFINLNTA